MRIVELKIDELDEISGFEATALVNQPAIEAGFHAFSSQDIEDVITLQLIKQAVKELFVTRLPGESKESYLERCIPQLKSEGYDQDQAVAICMDTFDIDAQGLPNYDNEASGSEITALSQENYFDNLPDNIQDRLLETLSTKGSTLEELRKEGYEVVSEAEFSKAYFDLSKNQIADTANPDGVTNDRTGQFKILYQYRGPRDSKNRTFCRKLLDLDLLFRKEDIEKLTLYGANSSEFGLYNIFEFKGSFGCRHRWTKVFTYKKKSGDQFSSNKHQFATDSEQQMVVGPLMIPDKLIFRVDESDEPYYVYFSKDTVINIANKMMKSKLLDAVNLEHDPESPVDGYMVESWIITDTEHDKSRAYGFNFPEGTWMGMYKIEDPAVWEMVKQKIVTGFSIEGFFADNLIQS